MITSFPCEARGKRMEKSCLDAACWCRWAVPPGSLVRCMTLRCLRFGTQQCLVPGLRHQTRNQNRIHQNSIYGRRMAVGTSMTRIFSQCTHCCPLSEDVQHCSTQDVLEAVSLFKLHGQLSGLVIWNSFVVSGGADHAAELHKEMFPSPDTVSAVSIGMGKLEPVGWWPFCTLYPCCGFRFEPSLVGPCGKRRGASARSMGLQPAVEHLDTSSTLQHSALCT